MKRKKDPGHISHTKQRFRISIAKLFCSLNSQNNHEYVSLLYLICGSCDEYYAHVSSVSLK